MGDAVPTQHPAVVLRSHYTLVRALLAVAMIAVVGLSAAVVILATSEDTNTIAGSAAHVTAPASPPAGTRYDGGPEEGSADVAPSRPLPTQGQAFPGLARQATGPQRYGPRYDGGPEEGTRGSGH